MSTAGRSSSDDIVFYYGLVAGSSSTDTCLIDVHPPGAPNAPTVGNASSTSRIPNRTGSSKGGGLEKLRKKVFSTR